jgi:hypothetical protein
MWLFFGLSAAAIAGAWLFVAAKTISHSLGSRARETNSAGSLGAFAELELKLKNFQTVNKLLFEEKAAEAREELIQESVLQKLKEKLESSSSTTE